MSLPILHALHTVDPKAAGLTEDVLLLAAVHRSLRHRIEILTLDAPGTSWLRELGVPVHRVDSRRFFQWLGEHAAGYDCVLVSGISGCDAYRAWRVLKDAGTPYFVFAPRYFGFLSGLPRQVEKWKQRWCWPWAGYPLLREAHAVFFPNEEARREARACFWPYDCHEFVLACGAAEGEFLDGHPGLRGKRIFTVFAGESGTVPEALLGAVRALADTGRWERDSMRLLISGGADGAGAAAWRRAVDGRDLGGIVTLAAAPCGRARWGMLQASEALVQPARAENSGLMLAEAFAVGTPVLIARGVNPWREAVGHGAGFAGDDTVEGYAELFTRWFEQSREGRDAMRANARQAFETHYGEQAAANTLMAVAYLLIGANQAGGNSTDPEIFRHETDFL